jgi:hypothetical protein
MTDKHLSDLVEEQDHISKLAFTAVATPDPGELSGDSTSAQDSHEPYDLDHYKSSGSPATTKEVASYYAYYAGNNGIGSFQ